DRRRPVRGEAGTGAEAGPRGPGIRAVAVRTLVRAEAVSALRAPGPTDSRSRAGPGPAARGTRACRRLREDRAGRGTRACRRLREDRAGRDGRADHGDRGVRAGREGRGDRSSLLPSSRWAPDVRSRRQASTARCRAPTLAVRGVDVPAAAGAMDRAPGTSPAAFFDLMRYIAIVGSAQPETAERSLPEARNSRELSAVGAAVSVRSGCRESSGSTRAGDPLGSGGSGQTSRVKRFESGDSDRKVRTGSFGSDRSEQSVRAGG